MCLKLLLKRLAKWPGVSALFLPLVTCEGICGDQERYAKMQSMNSWPTTACVEAEADLVPPIWVNVLDASRTSRSLSVFWLLFYLWNKDIQRLRITMIMMSRISRLFRIFWKRIHLQPPLYEQGTRYIYNYKVYNMIYWPWGELISWAFKVPRHQQKCRHFLRSHAQEEVGLLAK